MGQMTDGENMEKHGKTTMNGFLGENLHWFSHPIFPDPGAFHCQFSQ
jgi:hypothetical protein